MDKDFSVSRPRQELPLYSKVQKTSPENFRFSGSKLSSLSLEHKFQEGRKLNQGTEQRKQNHQLHLETKRSNQVQDLNKNLTQVPLSEPNLILRSQLKLLERLEFNLVVFILCNTGEERKKLMIFGKTTDIKKGKKMEK